MEFNFFHFYETILHVAAKSNKKEIAEFILNEKLISISEKNNTGQVAADVSNNETTEYLKSISK